ncbi:Tetratricopeptide repeat [Salinivirga cyanobacteriivorans]|uniref:Tetratricopeptide repeat n=1 Tax=Salinivirga cyanobacteriivorans TaxID=1307839 RepID=A0A0S2I318_9BACT|nr:carboxypeptidase-like regulatory domain-containing protein [Salinivirga cyanobacteriivorans]ALO16808.1 Tetratricopeptide repeat [Salinivirga cyanobacteriivorans]
MFTIKRMKYFLLFFFIQSITFAQSYNNIQILDASSGSPLAYARIYNTETGRGFITNEDGVFRNAFSDSTNVKPIVRISYIGYETAFYSPAMLTSLSRIMLKTNTYSLAEVVVRPKSWAMDFLHEVIKRHKKLQVKPTLAKAYYSSYSTIDNQPVEVLELLANGAADLTEVQELRYKSGRIAHAPFNNTYFLNLQPRKYITSFKPFDNQRTTFPATFTGNNRLANNLFYDVTFVKEEYTTDDTLYHFECNSKKSWLMHAKLIASKKHRLFQSVKYSHEQVPPDLFQPINPTDRITSGQFSITATYDLKMKTINSVSLGYNIDYLFANGKQSKIKMQANNLFYDFNITFIDILGINTNDINDYDLVYNMPYFEQLWQHETQGISKRQETYIDFFKKNGSLVNYGTLQTYLETYIDRFRRWTPRRLQFEELNAASLYWYKKHENDHLDYNPAELIRIEAQNVFDVVELNDTVLWDMKTIIDLNESFCFLVPDTSLYAYMNIYFDLYKITENELSRAISQSKQPQSVVNIIKTIDQMSNKRLAEYIKNVRLGGNTGELAHWNKIIDKELNINNIDSARIYYNNRKQGDSIVYNPVEGSTTFIHDYYDKYSKSSFYNNGIILTKRGKIDAAIAAFTRSIDSVENEPYAYYNRALLYIKQQDTTSACIDLKEALKQGVAESKNLINRYCRKSKNETIE